MKHAFNTINLEKKNTPQMAFYSHQNKKKRIGGANFDSRGQSLKNGDSHGSVTQTKSPFGNNTYPKKGW